MVTSGKLSEARTVLAFAAEHVDDVIAGKISLDPGLVNKAKETAADTENHAGDSYSDLSPVRQAIDARRLGEIDLCLRPTSHVASDPRAQSIPENFLLVRE